MPEPQVTYLQSHDLATIHPKSFATLERFAEVFIQANAVSEHVLLSVRKAARLVGMDPGNATRALKDKPGFVTVRQEDDTPKGSRAVGIYYAFDFVACAASQGTNYPRNVTPLLGKRIPKEILLPKERKPLGLAAEPREVKPDLALAKHLGADIDKAENVVVPTLINSNNLDHRSVINLVAALSERFHADGEYEPMLEYKIENLPDADLATMVDVFGKMSINFTSIYKTLAIHQEGRELK